MVGDYSELRSEETARCMGGRHGRARRMDQTNRRGYGIILAFGPDGPETRKTLAPKSAEWATDDLSGRVHRRQRSQGGSQRRNGVHE